MSVFDAEVSVLSATLNAPTPEALQNGATPHLELGIVAGLPLPVPNPQTGQPLVIPFGRLRFAFERQPAIDLFGAALKAAQDLPADIPSDKVMVAHSMADVEAAAETIRRATGQ